MYANSSDPAVRTGKLHITLVCYICTFCIMRGPLVVVAHAIYISPTAPTLVFNLLPPSQHTPDTHAAAAFSYLIRHSYRTQVMQVAIIMFKCQLMTLELTHFPLSISFGQLRFYNPAHAAVRCQTNLSRTLSIALTAADNRFPCRVNSDSHLN